MCLSDMHISASGEWLESMSRETTNVSIPDREQTPRAALCDSLRIWDLVYVAPMILDFHLHLPHLVNLLTDIFSSIGQYLETSLFKAR